MGPDGILLTFAIIALSFYAVLGGADFGAGVWEFNTAMRASAKERQLLYKAIGPVWEANHVWLIFVLILMMNGFPIAFAALGRALWLPLLLALVGIVFRGAAFAFRTYSIGDKTQQHLWERVFAVASTAAPFFLGASVGALSSGQLEVNADGSYTGNHLTGWINMLSIFCGFFAVGMCAYLAAVYMTREADQMSDADMVETWRTRAMVTGIAMGILALTGLVQLFTNAPSLWQGFTQRAWPLIAISFCGGIGSLWSLTRRRFTLANLMAALAVASVIGGWGISQYPVVVPPAITVELAKAPDNILWANIIVVLAGSVLLFPSMGLLLWMFKKQQAN